MKKVEKPKVPDNKYNLSINTPLLYMLQQMTGDSSFKIISFFYDLMLKQRAEIELTQAGKNEDSKYTQLQQKKTYGYYPGTSAYFIICTTKKLPYNGYGYGMNQNRTPDVLWDCNVSLIRGATDFNHEALEKMMAEGILLGDAAVAPFPEPHLKKVGRKDNLSALKDNTESKEEV